MGNGADVSAALRQIARGIEALAEAVDADGTATAATKEQRQLAVLREWGDRGLTRAEVSALFRRYGFAPQAAGGWARGDWIESRDDGRSYITQRSRRVLQQEGERDD